MYKIGFKAYALDLLTADKTWILIFQGGFDDYVSISCTVWCFIINKKIALSHNL